MIRVGVLGPLTLTYENISYLPTPPKTRQLTALLALSAGQILTTDECITELWGTEPPRSAVATLRTYILQIRRMLRKIQAVHSGPVTDEVLQTRNHCLQLILEPASIDYFAFEQLSQHGFEAARRGDDRRASDRYAEALRLWRGPALLDVAHGPVLSAHLAKLTERRLGTLEQRVEADLRLGRHHLLLGELEVLVSRYPTNENIHAQFMLALYRSGRVGQAIDVFWRLRGVLGENFGIEPSSRMQRLYQAFLAGDPALAVYTAFAADHPLLALDLAR